jgi:hypothetical protein
MVGTAENAVATLAIVVEKCGHEEAATRAPMGWQA